MSINDPAAAALAAESSVPAQEITVDLTKLNALSPEVISKQATVSPGSSYFDLNHLIDYIGSGRADGADQHWSVYLKWYRIGWQGGRSDKVTGD